MKSAPLVSIVMLCWNRKDDVFESLSRIREIIYNSLEVIVVDNGSTDGTIELIKDKFPEVRLIQMYKNFGIEAYNIGFANAKGKYIVIIDDDSFPAKHSITRMVQRFEQDESLGAIAFDVRNFYHYDEISILAEEQPLERYSSPSKYYMSFNGAGVGVRASLFRRIGYYPEEFFLYNNEMDSAFRILNEGYRIEFHADIIAYHKYSPINRDSWRAPYYYVRNAFWLIWKNYPLDMVIKYTTLMVYKCLYASFEQRTWIYLKAMASAFINIKKLKQKRKPVQRIIAKKLRVPFDVFFTFYR